MALWECIGGADKGGILVRTGVALGAPQEKSRLSFGAIVEEVAVEGDRLHYKLKEGTGPAQGWVSIKISGKQLMARKDGGGGGEAPAAADAAAPGAKVDEALKADILKKAEEKKKAGAFDNYCFKYKVHKFPLEKPKMRIFCFHNAGSTESNYTRPNTVFTNWVLKEAKDVEICALDYPGRNKLLQETKHTSTETLAPDLVAAMYDKLADGVPYVVWGHSVGTWVAFEFMILSRKIGLPMPVTAILTGFPGPQLPENERRWRKSATLDEAGLKEELFNWDKAHFSGPGKVVFEDSFWTGPSGAELMRADFRLYDEYQYKHADQPKFDFPVHAMHMEDEFVNLPDQIKLWGAWTNKFDYRVMKEMGHLNCFIMPDKIRPYFTAVTDIIKSYYTTL